MTSSLTSSALILAALAAAACWSPESPPACDESRPVFGAKVCCERHKVAGQAAVDAMTEHEADRQVALGPLAPP